MNWTTQVVTYGLASLKALGTSTHESFVHESHYTLDAWYIFDSLKKLQAQKSSLFMNQTKLVMKLFCDLFKRTGS